MQPADDFADATKIGSEPRTRIGDGIEHDRRRPQTLNPVLERASELPTQRRDNCLPPPCDLFDATREERDDRIEVVGVHLGGIEGREVGQVPFAPRPVRIVGELQVDESFPLRARDRPVPDRDRQVFRLEIDARDPHVPLTVRLVVRVNFQS